MILLPTAVALSPSLTSSPAPPDPIARPHASPLQHHAAPCSPQTPSNRPAAPRHLLNTYIHPTGSSPSASHRPPRATTSTPRHPIPSIPRRAPSPPQMASARVNGGAGGHMTVPARPGRAPRGAARCRRGRREVSAAGRARPGRAPSRLPPAPRRGLSPSAAAAGRG